jgi:hypothetical protein
MQYHFLYSQTFLSDFENDEEISHFLLTYFFINNTITNLCLAWHLKASSLDLLLHQLATYSQSPVLTPSWQFSRARPRSMVATPSWQFSRARPRSMVATWTPGTRLNNKTTPEARLYSYWCVSLYLVMSHVSPWTSVSTISLTWET